MQVNIMEVFDMISALYRKELTEYYIMEYKLNSIVNNMKDKDISHADYIMMCDKKNDLEKEIVKKQAYVDGIYDARETLWDLIPDNEGANRE